MHVPAHMTLWSGPYDYISALVSSDLMTLAVSKPRCYAAYLYTILMDYDHMPIMPYLTIPYHTYHIGHMPFAHMTVWSGPYDYIGALVNLMIVDDFGCVKTQMLCYLLMWYTYTS